MRESNNKHVEFNPLDILATAASLKQLNNSRTTGVFVNSAINEINCTVSHSIAPGSSGLSLGLTTGLPLRSPPLPAASPPPLSLLKNNSEQQEQHCSDEKSSSETIVNMGVNVKAVNNNTDHLAHLHSIKDCANKLLSHVGRNDLSKMLEEHNYGHSRYSFKCVSKDGTSTDTGVSAKIEHLHSPECSYRIYDSGIGESVSSEEEMNTSEESLSPVFDCPDKLRLSCKNRICDVDENANRRMEVPELAAVSSDENVASLCKDPDLKTCSEHQISDTRRCNSVDSDNKNVNSEANTNVSSTSHGHILSDQPSSRTELGDELHQFVVHLGRNSVDNLLKSDNKNNVQTIDDESECLPKSETDTKSETDNCLAMPPEDVSGTNDVNKCVDNNNSVLNPSSAVLTSQVMADSRVGDSNEENNKTDSGNSSCESAKHETAFIVPLMPHAVDNNCINSDTNIFCDKTNDTVNNFHNNVKNINDRHESDDDYDDVEDDEQEEDDDDEEDDDEDEESEEDTAKSVRALLQASASKRPILDSLLTGKTIVVIHKKKDGTEASYTLQKSQIAPSPGTTDNANFATHDISILDNSLLKNADDSTASSSMSQIDTANQFMVYTDPLLQEHYMAGSDMQTIQAAQIATKVTEKVPIVPSTSYQSRKVVINHPLSLNMPTTSSDPSLVKEGSRLIVSDVDGKPYIFRPTTSGLSPSITTKEQYEKPLNSYLPYNVNIAKPTTPVKMPELMAALSNASPPRYGQFRIGTFGSISSPILQIPPSAISASENIQTFNDQRLAGIVRKLSDSLHSTSTVESVSPVKSDDDLKKTRTVYVQQQQQQQQQSKQQLSSSISDKTSSILHDHDYCAKSQIPPLRMVDLYPYGQSQPIHNLSRKRAYTVNNPVSDSSGRGRGMGKQRKRPKKGIVNGSNEDLISPLSPYTPPPFPEMVLPASMFNLADDDDDHTRKRKLRTTSGTGARPKSLDSELDEELTEGEQRAKVRITGSFQDDFVYYVNKTSRSRRRDTSGGPLFLPNPNLLMSHSDIYIPHLSDGDIAALKANPNLKLPNFTSPGSHLSNSSAHTSGKSCVTITDEDNKVINTILNMENNLDKVPGESDPVGDDFNMTGLNLTAEEMDMIFNAIEEVQSTSPTSSNPSSDIGNRNTQHKTAIDLMRSFSNNDSPRISSEQKVAQITDGLLKKSQQASVSVSSESPPTDLVNQPSKASLSPDSSSSAQPDDLKTNTNVIELDLPEVDLSKPVPVEILDISNSLINPTVQTLPTSPGSNITTPWIVTVTMYWNDLPAVMIESVPFVRLIDIYKQILPAKDTGILKKRALLLGMSVRNCTEMQRYFIVKYGHAYNSKSTLIISKDEAKKLIGFYVDPQPKVSRSDSYKVESSKNTVHMSRGIHSVHKSTVGRPPAAAAVSLLSDYASRSARMRTISSEVTTQHCPEKCGSSMAKRTHQTGHVAAIDCPVKSEIQIHTASDVEVISDAVQAPHDDSKHDEMMHRVADLTNEDSKLSSEQSTSATVIPTAKSVEVAEISGQTPVVSADSASASVIRNRSRVIAKAPPVFLADVHRISGRLRHKKINFLEMLKGHDGDTQEEKEIDVSPGGRVHTDKDTNDRKYSRTSGAERRKSENNIASARSKLSKHSRSRKSVRNSSDDSVKVFGFSNKRRRLITDQISPTSAPHSSNSANKEAKFVKNKLTKDKNGQNLSENCHGNESFLKATMKVKKSINVHKTSSLLKRRLASELLSQDASVRISARKRKLKQLYPIENYSMRFLEEKNEKLSDSGSTSVKMYSDIDNDDVNLDKSPPSKILRMSPRKRKAILTEVLCSSSHESESAEGSVIALSNGPEYETFTALRDDLAT